MNGQQPQASILSTLQPVMGALWVLFCFTQDGVSSVRYVFIISIRDFARHFKYFNSRAMDVLSKE